MDEKHQQLINIFYPNLFEEINRINSNNSNFVQYTSINAAFSIIKNEEVWLRNVRSMNDYSEVIHGWELLKEVYNNSLTGQKFKDILSKIDPSVENVVVKNFESAIEGLINDTYIACISEHLNGDEEKYGRLSMWRAYGGKKPVALVLDEKIVLIDNYTFETFLYPVFYRDKNNLEDEFKKINHILENNFELLKSLKPYELSHYIFEAFKAIALSSKHKGYSEEREWRLTYNPKNISKESTPLEKEIINHNDMPQLVYKLPLKKIPNTNYNHIEIKTILKKIIIGPYDFQETIHKSLIELLENASIESPNDLISISNIPERSL